MTKQQIEDEAIKYCSHIDFTTDKSLSEKGRQRVREWCKQDFIAGANWMQNGALPQAHPIASGVGGQFALKLTKEEAKLLGQSLSRTMAKGDALTFSMKLEDELYNFYK